MLCQIAQDWDSSPTDGLLAPEVPSGTHQGVLVTVIQQQQA